MDPFIHYGMAAAIQAMEDAGIEVTDQNRRKIGIVIGSGIGGLSEFETQHERLLSKGIDKVSPFTIPKLLINSASGHVSTMYGIKGPNFSVATACASAANSIGNALRSIQ